MSGELIKISRDVYSDDGKENDLSVIGKTYPYAVFTMNSAFYIGVVRFIIEKAVAFCCEIAFLCKKMYIRDDNIFIRKIQILFLIAFIV